MSLILLYMIFLRNRMVHIKEPVPYCPIVKGLVCVIYLLSARRNKKKKKKKGLWKHHRFSNLKINDAG